MRKPLLAVTLGDPAGIGPEVIVGAWSDPRIHQWCQLVAVGRPEILRRAIELRGGGPEVVDVASPEDALPSPALLPCLPAGSLESLGVEPCTVDPRAGQAAYDSLVMAAEMALSGRIDGLVTAPLHKEALWKAGHHYPGHTEMLAELCGVTDFAMMLYLGPGEGVHGAAGLGVIHVTLHMAPADALIALSPQAVAAKARLADEVMRALKDQRPRIGVCALNPHAGESGLFGREEDTLIRPGVELARAAGIDAEGPYPADTLMARARDGEFDGVVAMYHDQGHIALKMLGRHRAVNVTLGLPIVRTSVAHGTAFDIAWKRRQVQQTEVGSMIEAVRVAAMLVERRRRELA